MKSFIKAHFLVAVLLASVPAFGCKKNSGEDKAVVEGASKLPGTADVAAAIKKGDFDGALQALGKVKEACTTEEQNLQFSVYLGQLRQQVVEISMTNAAAAPAATALRAMSGTLR